MHNATLCSTMLYLTYVEQRWVKYSIVQVQVQVQVLTYQVQIQVQVPLPYNPVQVQVRKLEF